MADDTGKGLRLMLARYWTGCEGEALDADILAENVMWTWHDEEHVLERFTDEVEELCTALRGKTTDDQALLVRIGCPLPAGRSWQGWLRYLEEVVTAHYPHRRDRLLVLNDGMRLPRVSKFTDGPTADDATTQVLRAHEQVVRSWSGRDDGTRRLHLYADLGRPVGVYLERENPRSRSAGDAAADHRAADHQTAERPATGCVVVLRRDPSTGRAYVGHAYPEKRLEEDVRELFPDLPLLFGGYAGQDWDSVDGDLWAAERHFNTGISVAVAERVAEQLQQLLTLGDARMLEAVEALGSYVLPVATRRWVAGLHRRMTRLDWGRR